MKQRIKFFVSSGIALTCLAGMLVGATEMNPVACTLEYAPVCAFVQVQCITTPCPPVQETFGNKCAASASTLPTLMLYAGECRDRMSQPTVAQVNQVEKVLNIFFDRYQTSENVLTDQGMGIAQKMHKLVVKMIEVQEQLIISSTMTPEQSAKATARLTMLYAIQDYIVALILQS